MDILEVKLVFRGGRGLALFLRPLIIRTRLGCFYVTVEVKVEVKLRLILVDLRLRLT